jgi:hypothetical protein
VAFVIWLAVVPEGNTPRSNCTSAVYPPPTFKLLRAPEFTVGRALDTCVSATSVACTAHARALATASSSTASARPTLQPPNLPLTRFQPHNNDLELGTQIAADTCGVSGSNKRKDVFRFSRIFPKRKSTLFKP